MAVNEKNLTGNERFWNFLEKSGLGIKNAYLKSENAYNMSLRLDILKLCFVKLLSSVYKAEYPAVH